MNELSATQTKVLLFISRHPNANAQIAGYGRAPWLSAARALVRRGLAGTYLTGHYYLTDEGKALAVKTLEGKR